MTRDLEFARTMLTVAKAGLANQLVDHDLSHPRVKDALENVAGWAREVERLERAEDVEAA
jgi:hypothetical protein